MANTSRRKKTARNDHCPFAEDWQEYSGVARGKNGRMRKGFSVNLNFTLYWPKCPLTYPFWTMGFTGCNTVRLLSCFSWSIRGNTRVCLCTRDLSAVSNMHNAHRPLCRTALPVRTRIVRTKPSASTWRCSITHRCQNPKFRISVSTRSMILYLKLRRQKKFARCSICLQRLE